MIHLYSEMYRILKLSSVPVRRTILLASHFKSNKLFHKKVFNVKKSEKCMNYSTIPSHKVLEPIVSKKQNQNKFKAKPYEELLKVLEAREKALKSKTKPVESTSIALNTSNIAPDAGPSEGIFTVKYFLKPKEKKSAKAEKTSADVPDKSSKKKKVKKNLSEIQEEFKRSLNHSYAIGALKTYMEVSVNADEVEKAQNFLRKRLEKLKNKYKVNTTIDVNLYNVLISGWSLKGKLDRVKQLMSLMETDGVAPNLQTYAHYFECLSRGKFLDIVEIQKIANQMKTKGLTHQDILHSCIFIGDQREKVIEALGYVDGNLSPRQPPVPVPYSCKLLQKLNDPSYERGTIRPDFCFKEGDISDLSDSQMHMENRFSQQIKSVAGITCTKKTLKYRKYLEECENKWREKLTAALNNFSSFEKKHHEKSSHAEESTYPYLAVIDTEILVNLLMQEIRLLAETGEFFSPQEKYLYKGLGVKVMFHYFIWLNRKNEISEKVHFIYKKYLSYLLDSELLSKYSPREYWEYLKTVYPEGPTIDIANSPWPYSITVKLGCELYDILQRNIAFDPNVIQNKAPSRHMAQAFYVTYEDLQEVKISKHIRIHPLLCKLYREAQLDYLEFDVTLLPMLSPPKPWVRYDSGGLLITMTPFIRCNDHAVYQSSFYGTIPQQELYPCFDSLNSLSLCPWIINKPVLDLIINVFQNGGNEELDIPLNPNSFPAPPSVNSSLSKQERARIWKQRKDMKKKKCETASLWFDCLYKLSIANHFRDKVFWFPHNLDFRGRVYPTPPHFNHLGSDMARSILLFAEGKPLGKKGLDWLKIQLINLTGFKKRDPHSVRLEYANEMIPEILDSADNPFEGNKWWTTSDKPWQTLACCKDLANALRHPNPEEYVSHYPIHQDGSCNGLQHYAALGRDELGAIEVNLHPSAAPQDVYSGVSALVERERQKDAAAGEEVAIVLDGFVRRKVVKQTVMTFVYGVTRYGAKLQILKQLKDIPEFPDKYHSEASTYIMKKIFLSIKEMFTATQEIQDWFTDCAEHLTRVSGNTLEWVTPLGLPVIQPYHKETRIKVPKFLILQGTLSNLEYSSQNEPYQLPNVRKQKNGFAPNFIHSLDASHMMLTSLYCQRKGITFVSVHDCYWTHASSVAVLNRVCREQFVSLHSEPILEDLSEFFLKKYGRVLEENIQVNKTKDKAVRFKLRELLCKVPIKGTFDLNKVLESEYFFS